MEVEGSLGVGSRLVVNTCAMTAEERNSSSRDQPSLEDDNGIDQEEEDPLANMR